MDSNKRFLPSYDVVVVGGGLGGLCACLKLALGGANVLLLEQHNMTGGYATSFVRGRFEFEVSLHELCECGDAIGEHSYGGVRKILDSCGVVPEYRVVPDAYRVILSDMGIDFVMPFGIENAIAAIAELEPEDEPKIRNYMKLCEEIFDALNYIGSVHGEPDGKVMMMEHSAFLRTAGYNAAEVIDSFNFSPRTKHIISAYYGYIGRRLSETSFIIWTVMQYTYLRDGGHIINKTSHALACDIEKRSRELGAQIETSVRVDRLISEGGAVVGVVTADGTEIRAKQVLCNLLPTTVYKKMLEPKDVPEAALKLTGARKLGGSPYGVYLGLDATPEEMGITHYEYFIGKDMDTERIFRDTQEYAPHPKLSATCADVAVPGFSGEGRCQLNFTCLYDPDAMSGKHTDKYNYLPEKERFANVMIDYFEEMTGARIRDHIEEIEISTPATYVRYSGAFKGNIYGYVCDAIDGVVPRILQAEAERYIPGLDFVGGAANRAHGFSSCITSGHDAGMVTLRRLKGGGK